MFNRRSLIAIALAGSALAGSNAFAQDQATVGIQTTTNYSSTGASRRSIPPPAR